MIPAENSSFLSPSVGNLAHSLENTAEKRLSRTNFMRIQNPDVRERRLLPLPPLLLSLLDRCRGFQALLEDSFNFENLPIRWQSCQMQEPSRVSEVLCESARKFREMGNSPRILLSAYCQSVEDKNASKSQ